MGMQGSHALHPQVPSKEAVRRTEHPFWRSALWMLARQKEGRGEEGHLIPDRVYVLISILLKCAVSQMIELLKGSSAIHLTRV